MNTKLKWLMAVTVVAAGGFYAYNLRVTSGHVPADLRDAVADNSALEQLGVDSSAPGGSLTVPTAAPVAVAKTSSTTVKGASRSQEVVLLKLRHEDGQAAELVAEVSMAESNYVQFRNIRVRMNGRAYRVNGSSEYRYAICKPYAAEFPFVYATEELRGFFEKAVLIDKHLVVHDSDIKAVVFMDSCGKQDY